MEMIGLDMNIQSKYLKHFFCCSLLFLFFSGFPSSLPSISPVPSPSISFDSNAMLGGGPSCNSLVDQQYPIFSDICGAVPQARYSLPNSFGHRERWQIAHILSSLASSSTDAACTRSLRLLLCPVLFPPCPTRYEPPPVLPCQSYCRGLLLKDYFDFSI